MSHGFAPMAVAAITLASTSVGAIAQQAPDTAPVLLATHALERITVTGSRPATLPVEIPTTLESITGDAIAKSINASDAEDALKYFPSLNVRKRYIGDYDHAVLASRASGSGNSARSLVYADGILLSNLLGNGAGFTPRWGLVTPEEVERVDVLYGPFSAAYSGNSAGAIVDFVTRMPKQFEAHFKLQASTQHYTLYGTDQRYSGGQGSASIGSRAGALSWWVDVSRLDSQAQPMGFVVKNLPAAPSAVGTPVTGAFADRNPRNIDGVVLGTTGQTHTVQDHAKLKFAYDLTPTLRASYTLGYWHNEADRGVDSFLRDGNGSVVSSGPVAVPVNIDGRSYSIAPTDFAASRAGMEHSIQALGLKSNTRGTWDWEAAASVYDYQRDRVRSQLPDPSAPTGGRIADQGGTGWNTLALKGIWRPEGLGGTHIAEFGAQRDAFKLRTSVSGTPDWSGGAPTAAVSGFNGDTSLTSLWAQDAWRFAPAWKTVLGLRVERWRAFDGSISSIDASTGASVTRNFVERAETHVSPKAALSWQASDDWTLRASLGRAVRMPTVSELFQGSLVAGEIINNDPNLKPEKSWTTELTAERELGHGLLRTTLFFERTADALYSQINAAAGGTVATIQNVDAIRTAGLEVALQTGDMFIKGFDLGASLTYADSTIVRNDKLPASVGMRQPRVPAWRAAMLASYTPNDRWSGSFGLRYSGTQYGQLDNSDSNGYSYTGFSPFLVADLRLQYRPSKQWTLSAGVDNLNNRRYWAFHPYPQRTFHAEVGFDL